jgi:ribulose-phosphate 3-epimerase
MRPAAGWLDVLPSGRLLAEFSLWSADLTRLADEIARVDAYVDIYHIDVADGRFTPALLFFPDLAAAVRKHTARPLHVHLMVTDDILQSQIEQFAEAGADLITVHGENRDIEAALTLIERLGALSGLVLQLDTPITALTPYLDRIRIATLLGTPIGVKGQGLDPEAEARLTAARTLISGMRLERRVILAADGAIREQTVPGLRRAGADAIVMGSLAFNAEDLAKRMAWVHAQTSSS